MRAKIPIIGLIILVVSIQSLVEIINARKKESKSVVKKVTQNSSAMKRTTSQKKATKKICFIAGNASHRRGSHEHYAGCMLLAKILNESMPEINAVVHKNGWPDDPKFFNGADAIVIYCDGGGKHAAIKHLDQVDKMAEKGIGIAFIHYAVEMREGNSSKKLIDWIGGCFEIHWSVNPFWTAEFKTLPDHPITRGVKPFSLDDEWYFHMRFRKDMKDVIPILSAHPPKKRVLSRPDGAHSNNPHVRAALNRGEIQHVAWTVTRPDGGRGFGLTGGHLHLNWKDDDFRKIVLNAITWIAKVEVPPDGVPSKTPTDKEMEENFVFTEK